MSATQGTMTRITIVWLIKNSLLLTRYTYELYILYIPIYVAKELLLL